jgi:signal transduction histidine kinase
MSDRPSIRLKLTLLYTGLFIIASVLLLLATYGLVRHELDRTVAFPPASRVGETTGGAGGGSPSEGGAEPGEVEVRILHARGLERKRALKLFARRSFLTLAVMTGIAVFLGWFVAGRVLDPIRTITEHARSASVATLDQRIAMDGPDDELKELADTFDGMLDRMHAAFRAQQSFAAQASHELRTPLSIIRAQAEMTLADVTIDAQTRAGSGAILTAALRSEHLIDGLLALARSESSVFAAEPIDLAVIVGDVVGDHVTHATAASIRLDLELDTAMVHGDRVLIRQMVNNLLENGFLYNEPNGFVLSQLRREGQFVQLVVSNSGPSVSQEEIATLFQPFVRGSWARSNRSGFGLGLAIARSVVQNHHGTIDAVARPEGGLRITVRLPAA